MRNQATIKEDVNIIKEAKNHVPVRRVSGVLHKQEPELAVMYFRGEVTSQQVEAALKAAGLENPFVAGRMAKALMVALQDGRVKLVDGAKK